MHLKHEITEHMLGLSVYMDKELREYNCRHPRVPLKIESNQIHIDPSSIAIMLPEEFHMVTVCVDEVGGIFMYTDMCPDSIFMAKASWQVLNSILPWKSVLHGIAYKNLANILTIGFFDASKIGGLDLSDQSRLARHINVHGLMHSNPLPPNVQYHWAGFKESCYINMQSESNPFKCHQMLVFEEGGATRRVIGAIST